MKKDLFFAIPMVVISILLFMLRLTHLPVHIVLSVLGVGILVAHAIIMKKEWKLPKFEIALRVVFGIAFVTGIVVMNVHGVLAFSIIHKASAVLFTVGFVALCGYKLVKSK